jgi:hypothetical protein
VKIKEKPTNILEQITTDLGLIIILQNKDLIKLLANFLNILKKERKLNK